MTPIRVLIADDHPLIREAFELMLERGDHVTLVATVPDGRQAVEYCASQAPDVVLLDYNMAGLDGRAAAQEIKRRFPDITIVGMSIAYDVGRIMSEAGADYFFDKTEILAKLPSVLDEVRRRLDSEDKGGR